MKINRLYIFILVCVLATLPPSLFACWKTPPEFRVQQVFGGEFFLRNIRSQETIEIRRAKDLTLKWKVKIEGYSDLFSIFRLSPDGKYLFHVRGNHMIGKMSDVCITVYSASGYRDSYKISEFWTALPKYKSKIRMSVDPQNVWHLDVREPSSDILVIQLDDTRFARISGQEHKVKIYQ